MSKTAKKTPMPRADLALLFTASRLALLLTGLLSTWVMMSGVKIQRANLIYHEPTVLPLEIWARWDSEWYLLIAEQGYDSSEHFEGLKYESNATAGFLPLYPILISVLSPLIGSVAAGVVVSNACLLVCLWLLYGLARREDGEEDGHVAGLATCAALLVFPTSLFLSAVYSESLFLMLSLLVFNRSLRGKFAAAGIAGALAALTRPTGVLLAIPIVVEWWMRKKRMPETSPLPAAWSLAPAAGLSLFLLFCGRIFGDPFALMARQERWRGGMSGPWRAFVRYFQEGPTPHGTHGSTVELILALFVIALLPIVYRKLRLSYALWATAMVLLPLSSTLWSFGRFALTVFPVFIVIGMGWTGRHKRLVALYGFIGATVSGLFMALFANWWWVG